MYPTMRRYKYVIESPNNDGGLSYIRSGAFSTPDKAWNACVIKSLQLII